MKTKKIIVPYIFLAPSLIGIIIFVLIPFADAVKRSFFEAMGEKFVGFKNYKSVINNGAFKLATCNTLKFMIICIPILIVLSLLLAVLLKSQTNDKFLKISFLIPMAIPVSSVVLLWKVFFHQSGILNEVISCFLKREINYDWINSNKSFYVLVFSYIWKNIGYDMMLWLAGLSAIPQSLYEAAKIDGANSVQRFFYITLPNIMPTVFIIVILSILNSFKVFREAYLISGDYPNDSIYMLQHLLNNWFVSLDIQKMCAASVLIAIFMLILILLLQKFLSKDNTGC